MSTSVQSREPPLQAHQKMTVTQQVGDYMQHLAKILLSIETSEQKFLQSCSLLFQKLGVNPAEIFQLLDVTTSGYILENDFRIFLEEFDIILTRKESRLLLRFFSKGPNQESDQKVTSEQFNTIFSYAPNLTKLPKQTSPEQPKATSHVAPDFSQILKTLAKDLKQLDDDKQLLHSNPLFDISDSFLELDLAQKGFINSRDIYDFLTDFFESVRFKMAERVHLLIPKNAEGKIDLRSWKDFLSPTHIQSRVNERLARLKMRGNSRLNEREG